MARRRQAVKRPLLPDTRFGDLVVARMIATVMQRGKKSTACRIVYGAINSLVDNGDSTAALEVLHRAIDTVKPRVEVKARRVGGATYQVPTEVTPERGVSLAIRWLVSFAAKRKGQPMARALSGELKEAAAGQGGAVKKRDDVHKMAQANKAFAHFRW
jgi:small subunit ribosomal protein S7